MKLLGRVIAPVAGGATRLPEPDPNGIKLGAALLPEGDVKGCRGPPAVGPVVWRHPVDATNPVDATRNTIPDSILAEPRKARRRIGRTAAVLGKVMIGESLRSGSRQFEHPK
ncbi:MAG: hypothetical protein AAF989_13490, partial [Planctomycetota bacterium]